MDIGALVLNKILNTKDLDAWAKVKLCYFNPAYASIYAAINKHYSRYDAIPSFDELEITSREVSLQRSLQSLRELEVPEDIDLEVAIEALVNQYAQNETLKEIDKFLDKVTMLDATEIKDSLANIVLSLDEKTLASETVFTAANMGVFIETVDIGSSCIPFGINNAFDANFTGMFREELILVGGKRGSGKSVVCSNLSTAQYELGNSVVYFTIEMRAAEVAQRNMAILANVDHQHIRRGTLTESEVLAISKVRAGMFDGGEEAYQAFLTHKDKFKFERDLCKMQVKKDNQIVIVDDRALTTTAIDLHLTKLKALMGDKLTLGVVDYVNQIVIPGNRDMYDWKAQIELAKFLKNMARKHGIPIISPLQIDDNNGIRFAKGLLDSPDVAMILDPHSREDEAISFDTIKARSAPPLICTSPINWSTLRIDPREIPTPTKKEAIKKAGKEKTISPPVNSEGATDVPWDAD